MTTSTTLLDMTLGRGSSSSHATDARTRLQEAIDHASHLLPAQGPINVFIHHNTLHALEDLKFDDAVVYGGRIFDCQPYLSENRYREKLVQGRIRPADLQATLHAELGSRGGEIIAGLSSLAELRFSMLQYPVRVAPRAELRWFIAETDALTRLRSELPIDDRTRYLASAPGKACWRRSPRRALAAACRMATCGSSSWRSFRRRPSAGTTRLGNGSRFARCGAFAGRGCTG
jgi:hypothetical protein